MHYRGHVTRGWDRWCGGERSINADRRESLNPGRSNEPCRPLRGNYTTLAEQACELRYIHTGNYLARDPWQSALRECKEPKKSTSCFLPSVSLIVYIYLHSRSKVWEFARLWQTIIYIPKRDTIKNGKCSHTFARRCMSLSLSLYIYIDVDILRGSYNCIVPRLRNAKHFPENWIDARASFTGK